MAQQTISDLSDQTSDALAKAVDQQRSDRDPAHEDFYTWGWLLSELTFRLDDVAGVLAGQVARYGERRILRDDEEGADPGERLGEAVAHLRELAAALGAAQGAARAYHSAIGHISVEVDAP